MSNPARPRPATGFARNLLRFWRSLIAGDLAIAVLAGALIYRLSCDLTTAEMITYMRDQIGVAAALFGTVIAGLAIIAAFLNPQVVNLLGKKPDSIEKTFFHFWFVTFLTIADLMTAYAGSLAIREWGSHDLDRVVFGVSGFLFAYMLTSAFWLVGFIVNRAITTALLVAHENPGPTDDSPDRSND